MRTNIDLNEELIKQAFSFADVKTKKDLIHLALQEYIDHHKRKNLLELQGKISFAEDYNHKEMR